MELKVEIPQQIYIKLNQTIGKENIGKCIVIALEEYLEKKFKRDKDSFFQKTSSQGSGLSDVSKNHDLYLYGSK